MRLVGRTPAPQRWARAADVFAFLSRREGLGYVIIESMGCGIPAVVSPLDGIGHELVQHGRTGFVVDEPDDAAAVGARLRSLLDDAELRRRLGAEARHDVVARFSMQARARQLVGIYEGMRAEAGP